MSDRLQTEAFEALLGRAVPEVAELARGARALVLANCPQSYEIVWGHQGTVGYGTGPKKMTEHYSWLSFTKSYVQLGFNYGTELNDKAGLLEGTGAKMRHVKIRTPEDLHRPGLRDLLKQAIRHRVPKPQPLGPSASPKRKAPATRTKPPPTRAVSDKSAPAATKASRAAPRKLRR